MPSGGSLGYAPRETETLLRRAIEDPFGFSVVARRRTRGEREVVAYEVAFLLRHACSSRLINGPEPFASIALEPGACPFPTEEEVGRRNGAEGLDLLVAKFVVSASLSREDAARVRAQMPMAFVEMYAGNRVRELLYEVRGTEAAARAAAGGFEPVATHAAWHDAAGVPEESRSVVLRFDPSSQGALYNLLALRLLQYRPPILRLPPGAREIVRLAVLGESDAQIVAARGISPASLNSRWTRVFDLAARRMPDLFAVETGKSRDRGRLLAYVRDHPEEGWPYEPSRERLLRESPP